MVKELFTVKQTETNDKAKFTADGPEKMNNMIFKGVDNEGIVCKILFKGSPEAMAKRFAGFIGSIGDIEVAISTSGTQTTLTSNLANATKKSKGKASKAKPASASDEDDEDFEEELEKLQNA